MSAQSTTIRPKSIEEIRQAFTDWWGKHHHRAAIFGPERSSGCAAGPKAGSGQWLTSRRRPAHCPANE